MDKIIAEEKTRLYEYRRQFHLHEIPVLAGKSVLLVDDGLATGATAEVAVLSARKQNAMRIVVAAPVASVNAVELLRAIADGVEVLSEDRYFQAVGQFYEEFYPTTDAEVISLLRQASEVETSHH